MCVWGGEEGGSVRIPAGPLPPLGGATVEAGVRRGRRGKAGVLDTQSGRQQGGGGDDRCAGGNLRAA